MCDTPLPLVYSCSGCSNVAQLANQVAVRLDRTGIAEMSCIAGVGGDVRPLVARATSGRRIVALDGCALHCVQQCLHRHGVAPDVHVTLSELGLRKRAHSDCTREEADRVFHEVCRILLREDASAGND